MKLTVEFQTPGCADCRVRLRAKGYLAALLFWADARGPLEGWSALAALLLTGDLTNDGRAEQFGEFWRCLQTAAPETLVLPVPGNHDRLYLPCRQAPAQDFYAPFQQELLCRAAALGFDPEPGPGSGPGLSRTRLAERERAPATAHKRCCLNGPAQQFS